MGLDDQGWQEGGVPEGFRQMRHSVPKYQICDLRVTQEGLVKPLLGHQMTSFANFYL